MNEEWRPVVGFEHLYEVSNHGRVRRIQRPMRPGRLHGYLFVTLSRKGVYTKGSIHRLVAEAFIGPIPGKMEVNHLNGVRDDNRVENLEIVTHAENVRHARRVLGRRFGGIPRKGEANRSCKLTAAQVIAIRTRRSNGERTKDLGREFGVRQDHIYEIIHRRAWKHLPATPGVTVPRNSNMKLTAEEVMEIRTRRANGERGVDLAREFGMSPDTISDIVRRRTWKHLA